jgi:hypothetical protein
MVDSYNDVWDGPVFTEHSKCEGALDLFPQKFHLISPRTGKQIQRLLYSITYKGAGGIFGAHCSTIVQDNIAQKTDLVKHLHLQLSPGRSKLAGRLYSERLHIRP